MTEMNDKAPQIDRERIIDEIIGIAYDPETKSSERLRALSMLIGLEKSDTAENDTREKLDRIIAMLREV